MNDLPFTPFNPETPLQPEAPPVKPKRQSRKKVEDAISAQPRQRRTSKPKPAKRAPKFELQAILAATSGLKEADMKAFEAGLNLLMDTNKAGRARILEALGKVFA